MQSSDNIEIMKTEDGSQTLWLRDLDETYHSMHGALTESRYVFIENGFCEFEGSDSPITILEVGFGTGLNVLLTMKEAVSKGLTVEFHTIEAYPLAAEIYSQLTYGEDEKDKLALQQIHDAPWDVEFELDTYFKLKKIQIHWEDYQAEEQGFDLIYYDAFSPSKQSEMWDLELLEKMRRFMKTGAKMVTYCAQGDFKRKLKSLGFEVESLDGPPGKAQMVRASKQ